MGDGLTDKQLVVIGAMVGGVSQREAAEVAGVAEETVSRWVRHDALFAAELNRVRSEVWVGRVRRVRDLADLAIETVEGVLRDSDSDSVRLRAALAILDRCGLGEVGREALGPTTPEAVRGQWVEWQRNADQFGGLLDDLLSAGGADRDGAMAKVLEAEREARALTE